MTRDELRITNDECPPTYSALADFPEGGLAGKGGWKEWE